ncbi:hypothetical protein L5515_015811 [Caenorhabditis briggsae]|uniref:Uncharacterized protein n=1 Tax=Caenorhabditis briggsae TaxID=6238 RepID=A0AAE9EJT5_CAEBR|nr:hypothetical protein L5515_015811 [Caenorhabditis briggsae]
MSKELKILQQKAAQAKKLLELEEKKMKMKRQMRTKEMEILDQEYQYGQMKMTSLTKILNSISEKEKFDGFRNKSQKLVRLFEKFQKSFADCLKEFSTSKKSGLVEALNDVLESLQNSCCELRNLTIISDPEIPKNLGKIQEMLIEKMDQLDSEVSEISAAAEIFLENGLIQELDDLKKKFEELETIVEKSENLITMFDLPHTKRVEQVFVVQMSILSSFTPQIAAKNEQSAIESAQDSLKSLDLSGKSEKIESNKAENSKESEEIQKEEKQINMLSHVMETITNFSELLEKEQSEEYVKELVMDIKEMFGEFLEISNEDGGEKDEEMQHIMMLLGAITEMTNGVN